MSNPFNPKTNSFKDFEVMSDLEWHCTQCELESAQAKTWQIWRQMGIQMKQDEKGNYYKVQICNRCGKKTYHRGLVSLTISNYTKVRSSISSKLSKKIKYVFRNQEAFYLREMQPNILEIDHKYPQVRWTQDEGINPDNMGEQEIKEKFILLTSANNLLKSRNCEQCKKTGKRGSFPGIKYWYAGSEAWDPALNDKRGCVGCFWYDPYKWREELNKIVKK